MPDELPNARAAIFDLDGTLLDTLGDLSDGVNIALEANGFTRHSEEVIRGFIGDGAEMMLRRAIPDGAGDDAATLDACLASFHQHYGEHYADRTRPYPGIMEVVAQLRGRDIPLGILSNKPHAFTLQCAAAYFSDGQFQVVLGQREGIPKKPDPAGAVEAAKLLQVAVADCLYVGDSGVDMQTAKAAGMIPVGVSWGFRPAEELRAEGALAVVDSPAELLAAFR
jgi:phosphoglycolate phosphatase